MAAKRSIAGARAMAASVRAQERGLVAAQRSSAGGRAVAAQRHARWGQSDRAAAPDPSGMRPNRPPLLRPAAPRKTADLRKNPAEGNSHRFPIVVGERKEPGNVENSGRHREEVRRGRLRPRAQGVQEARARLRARRARHRLGLGPPPRAQEPRRLRPQVQALAARGPSDPSRERSSTSRAAATSAPRRCSSTWSRSSTGPTSPGS